MGEFKRACKVQKCFMYSMNMWYIFCHDAQRAMTRNARNAALKQRCPCKIIVHQISWDFVLVDSQMIAKAKKYLEIVKRSVSLSPIGCLPG